MQYSMIVRSRVQMTQTGVGTKPIGTVSLCNIAERLSWVHMTQRGDGTKLIRTVSICNIAGWRVLGST